MNRKKRNKQQTDIVETHQKINDRYLSTLGKDMDFLDDLPSPPPGPYIPFPFGTQDKEPLGWGSRIFPDPLKVIK